MSDDIAAVMAGMQLNTTAAASGLRPTSPISVQSDAGMSVSDAQSRGGSSVADSPELIEDVNEYISEMGFTLVRSILMNSMTDRKSNKVLDRWMTREARPDGGARGNLGPQEWELYRAWRQARLDDAPRKEASCLRKGMRLQLASGWE